VRVKDKKAGKAFLRQRRRHTPPRWRRKRVPTPANRASIGVYIHVQNDSSPINFPLTMGAVPALPLVSYAEPGNRPSQQKEKHADRKTKRKHNGKPKKQKRKHRQDTEKRSTSTKKNAKSDGRKKPKQGSNLRTRTQSLPNS
jgi:hypothetical protein